VQDRQLLLGGAKRNEVLQVWEVHRFGTDSYDDPDYVSIYGMRPADWYAQGVRLLGRTAVECTRDALGRAIAHDVAATARTARPGGGVWILDPFAGSANTLYWLLQYLPGARGVGYELDPSVFQLITHNVAAIASPIEIANTDYWTGIANAAPPTDQFLIPFIAPRGARGSIRSLASTKSSTRRPKTLEILRPHHHAAADIPPVLGKARARPLTTLVYESVSSTTSTSSYANSIERITDLQRREAADPRVNPACYSISFEHGHATPRAIVFLHGITSSPFQFRQLGELFFSRGYNVLIPRMPRHAYLNRLTDDPAHLTRSELRAYAAAAVDAGRGLAEHLTVAGLSVGGVLAAWCAQTRLDVDLAVLIAPAFAPYAVPLRLVPILARLARTVPNLMLWWDPIRRQKVGPPCSYPRFSTRAMAESFLVGLDVYRAARDHPPVARSILTVANPLEMSVNNEATRAVVRRWRAHTANVRDFTFGRQVGRLHDIIGPYQEHARTDYVYPILFDLIDRTP
jgi:dienelactone hydrolase